MSALTQAHLETHWGEADRAWRDPAQVVGWWRDLAPVDGALLRNTVSGDWWEVLDRLDACLVVSREYEHLLLALTVAPSGPRQSFMSLPHPSGLAFDATTRRLHVASTRNPNQVYQLAAVTPREADTPGEAVTIEEALTPREADTPAGSPDAYTPQAASSASAPQVRARVEPAANEICRGMLAPLSASFLPGRLYLHDLALIGGVLHGNAVGFNAVVRLAASGAFEVRWWPRTIEHHGHPDLSRNYLQLNSIAAGPDLAGSFFSASAAQPSRRRPGHRNFPVDRRGVIFSGLTREPIAGGLTRPHSARLHDDELWVDDSGYGRVVQVRAGALETVATLPGWTRGLTFAENVAFVGTSRVIPRFAHYAPGVNVRDSVCAVHALDARSGELLGSIAWPAGNQIFDIAVLPRDLTLGFPAAGGRSAGARALSSFFFSYHAPKPPGAP